jgi:multiple antibiotic resistance protein
MNLYTATITLFLVMNPLGNIPIFISALRDIPPQRRTRIIVREAIFAFLILSAFLFAGGRILEGLQITTSALSIAGGIILFVIAIRLIFPESKEKTTEPAGEPFLVPLAIPLFAGPATMAMVMLLEEQQKGSIWYTMLALIIAWSAASFLLIASSKLSSLLGKRGLIAMERLMGMILTTISVQMFLAGIEQYFHLTH